MELSRLFCLLLPLLPLLALVAAYDGEILELTKENFEEEINRHKYIFVNFYIPSCGHCGKLEPHFEELNTVLRREDSKIVLAKIHGHENREISDAQSVSRYPTLILYKDGKEVTDYKGIRERDHMYDWLNDELKPSIKHLLTTKALQDFQLRAEHVVVAFLRTYNNKHDDLFLELSKRLFDFHVPVAILSNYEILKEHKIEKDTIVMLHRDTYGRTDYLGTSMKIDSLYKWAFAARFPPINPYSKDLVDKLRLGPVRLQSLLFISKDSDEYGDIYKKCEKVATKLRGHVYFLMVDTDEEKNEELLELFKVKVADAPIIKLVDFDKMDDLSHVLKPAEATDFTRKTIYQFIQAYIKGERTDKQQKQEKKAKETVKQSEKKDKPKKKAADPSKDEL